MILSSELYRKIGITKTLFTVLKYVLKKYLTALLGLFKKEESSFHKANYLAKGIRNYPSLVTDDELNLKCISCGLCEVVCPTQCISVKKDELLNIPSSMTTGPVPLIFDIRLQECTRCSYCIDVCPVDAINLRGVYDFYADPSKEIWNIKDLTSK